MLVSALFAIGWQKPAGAEDVLTLAYTEKAPVTQRAKPRVLCALDQLHRPYKLVNVPWKRAQEGTRSARFDGFFIASENEERNSYATKSSPVLTTRWYYVTSNDQPITPENKAFYRLTFGANLGTARQRWLEQKLSTIDGARVVEVPQSIESVWYMLAQGRIDVLLENEFNLQKHGEALAIKTFVARQKMLHVYFAKTRLEKSPYLLAQFNQALRICENS